MSEWATACSTVCADMTADPKNCGKCGTTCASGICTAGVCQKVKDCLTKAIIVTPLVADFESYDGTTAATSWGWAFNAPAGAANAVYAGLYDSNDGTGTPLLAIVGPGYNNSKYAASISNTQATKWGGQLGMWMGCMDASAYAGISFWVKGSVPGGTATLALATAGTSGPDSTGFGGGTCTSGTCAGPSITFPVTSDWSQVLVPWATFTAGTANGGDVATTGSDITGMSWNAALAYAAIGDGGYAPTPGAYNLSVDNVQFMTNTACGTGLTVCGTGCVDTTTNNANCGTCGNACESPRTCGSGKCNCPSGYTDCNGQCVNTQIDAQNCGGCGKACTGVCSSRRVPDKHLHRRHAPAGPDQHLRCLDRPGQVLDQQQLVGRQRCHRNAKHLEHLFVRQHHRLGNRLDLEWIRRPGEVLRQRGPGLAVGHES